MRIDRPRIIRGPAADELDSFFTEIRRANGLKRGFTANTSTYAMDGKEPWVMGGVRRKVLSDTVTLGGVVHGFVHAESDCNYLEGRTHKSMAFATSSNEGLTWSLKGQIITGTDAPAPSIHTGVQDKWFGGLKASFSSDKLQFTTMAEPWLAVDDDEWNRPAPTELLAYVSVLSHDQVMTKPHPTLATVKPRVRTAGWSFEEPQPNTLPLYRCYNPEVRQHFVSNQANCEGKGSQEWLMGHALAW